MRKALFCCTGGLLGCLGVMSPVMAQTAVEDLQDRITEQQKEIERLKKKDRQLEQQLESTTNYVEKTAAGAGGRSRTTVGGYGELHYNNYENKKDDSDFKEIDFHRFVLFFGYEFTDRIRFHSELELEHALVKDTQCSGVDGVDTAGDPSLPDQDIELNCGDKGPGEVELEQAYIEFDILDSLSAKGGLFLVPVGILNETHEPPTFYGVERNPVEKNIIPTTWWESGAGISGRFGGAWSYDLAYHSGLEVPTSGSKAYKIRDGRQKSASANAEDWATTGKLKWTGVPGLELAVTAQYQQDITQGQDSTAGDATLLEGHVVFSQGPFGLKALYATWDLDGDGPKAVGRDEQTGYYIEPAIKFGSKIGLFARYNVWDNNAGNSIDTEYKQTDVGVNYWPHENVVVKLDYQDQDAPDNKDEFDGFNLGIGYMF